MLKNKWLIFGCCNPMIDITAVVDKEFLKKYDLQPNDAIIGEAKHLKIYDDIKTKYTKSITHTSGGSGQNTLRIASWILNIPNSTVFMGSVGRDTHADIIVEKANEIGLKTLFQTTDKEPSATCAILLTDNNRSMVAHLGAAYHFTEDFLDISKNWSYVENARLFYITGFFFCTSMSSVIRIAKYAHENDRLLCINLSALFLTQYFKKEFIAILPYVDILFGNDDEAISFAKNVLNMQITKLEIKKLVKIISSFRKLNKKKRIVIITRAEKPVIYFDGTKVYETLVPPICSNKIIDTSCAGDAFVGGFLAQFVKNESLERCVDCGIWASGLIIQRSGCDIPTHMSYSQSTSTSHLINQVEIYNKL